MTELDMFYHFIPDIAEMIVYQREDAGAADSVEKGLYRICKEFKPVCMWVYP